MNYPNPGDELPKLEHAYKPKWRGLVARFVGLVVWLARHSWGAAKVWGEAVYFDFVQCLDGVVYTVEGREVPDRIWLHEGVHNWQRVEIGPWAYRWRYLTRPQAGRLVLEAQAYGSEVVAGHRSFGNALSSLVKPAYYPEPWRKPPTREEGHAALTLAVEGWRAAGFDQATIRALGETARPA